MIDQLTLLWRFLQLQPWMQWVTLVSWHLLAVLFVLGVLSAFGLHFLVGHVFGFYRRKGRLTRWVAWPTAVVYLVSVQALLAAYLLGVQAPELVRANLTGEVTTQLGRQLLAPAFKRPVLAAQPSADVAKAALTTALHTYSELDYRSALVAEQVPLSQFRPGADGEAGPRGPDVLVQIGLRWVTAPHSTWMGPERRLKAGASQGEQPFFLPDFLVSLVDELPSGTVLPRLDWEHVAGTRFVEGVLRPLVEEYLVYLAGFAAALVLLIDLVYFLLMGRLKRIGQPKPAKKEAAPKPSKAASPAPPATARPAKGAPFAPAMGNNGPGAGPPRLKPEAPQTPAVAGDTAPPPSAPAAAKDDGAGAAAPTGAPHEGVESSATTPDAPAKSNLAPVPAPKADATPMAAPAEKPSRWRLFKR